MEQCLICGAQTESFYDPITKTDIHHCSKCSFAFKDKGARLSQIDEEQEYLRHNNSMESTGYVNMFKVFMKENIKPFDIHSVLDFGSGPGPVLYQLLLQDGYDANHYDPFYHKDDSVFNKTYDCVTTTEVVEHFYNPFKEFQTLSSLVKPGGYLAIMTQFRPMDMETFKTWWYKRDVSHVSFYSLETFTYIADTFGFDIVQHNNKNTILLQKK
jgi:hypothetical protein